jgi:conjugative transposon TraN protein
MKYKVMTMIIGVLYASPSVFSQTNLIPIHNSDTLYVSDIKTTHLLFKENIKYVDVGSPYFIADTLQKMVRLKHIGEALTDIKSLETNLTIITDEGSYYSMYLGYNRFAMDLNYEVSKSEQIIPFLKEEETIKIEKTQMMSSLCNTIGSLDSNTQIKNNSSGDLGIKVTGIFYLDEKIAIKTQLTNDSGIDFDIDQIIFRAKLDKKLSADYLYQERIIAPIYVCNTNSEISGGGHSEITFLFNKFMLNENEKLYIDVFEENGGRSATLYIPRKKLLKLKIF